MSKRYKLESGLRDATTGEWLGIPGKTAAAVIWYYIKDTSEYGEYWNDAEIAPSPYLQECQEVCDLLNKYNERLNDRGVTTTCQN